MEQSHNQKGAPPETISARPTVRDLTVAVVLLGVAALLSLVFGAGLGALVLTLGVLAASLWLTYGAPTTPTPPVEKSVAAPAPAVAAGAAATRSWSVALPKVQAPSVSVDRSSLTDVSILGTAISVLGIVLVGGYLFLKDRSINPPGFFADEAEIGVQAQRLLHWNASTTRIPFFYQHLEYDHLGTLSLFATAPFVGLFGLTQEAVRGASVFWTIAAALVIYFTLRWLKVPYAAVPVIAMLAMPISILIGRTNFGHAPSLFFMSLGFLLWVKGRSSERLWVSFAAGLSIGLSAYGQSSYYVAAPLLIGAILLVEIVYTRANWRDYASAAWLLLGGLLILLPVPIHALTSPDFLDRYRDKTTGSGQGLDRVVDWIHGFPAYFRYDMLFVHAAGSWRTRHYFPGAPFLYPSLLIFIVLGLISLILIRGDSRQRYFWPMALVLLLYPIPDLVSRGSDSTPYSFSMVWGMIAIPFVVGYGFKGFGWVIGRLGVPKFGWGYAAAILLATLFGFNTFWGGAFENYPNVSADYWGWQFGPKASTDYFKAHAGEYDEFYLSGDFNAAAVLTEFFSSDSPIAGVTSTGGLEHIDPGKRQLFAIRADEWARSAGSQFPARSYVVVVDTIDYPDGTPAMYLVTLDPALQRPGETTDPAG